MTLGFGSVRKKAELQGAAAIDTGPRAALSPPAPRIAPAAVVEAAERARRIVAEAEQRAAELLRRAESELASLRARVSNEARAEATAALAARTLALAAFDAASDERAKDRWVELARLLAERLLGQALALDPALVTELADTALAEARGARHIVLAAHPEDVPLLERARAENRLSHVTRIVARDDRARGSLRLETEIGVLDADLAPQLDRLAARLRETLRHER